MKLKNLEEGLNNLEMFIEMFYNFNLSLIL